MEIEKISIVELAEINRLGDSFLEKHNLNSDNDVLHSIKEDVDIFKRSTLPLDQISDTCFQMGSAYGILINKSFGWDWFKIKKDNQFAYAVCTSNHSYGVQVFYYFNLLLTTEKENNTILLFNMLSELNSTNKMPITFLL